MADPNDSSVTSLSVWQVWLVITSASLSASFSGFASNIYFPAIPTMATALNTSVENINLTVTSYMVMQAVAPTFWGSVLEGLAERAEECLPGRAISDVFGRRITLITTFTVFLCACIGLALTQHYFQLVILRCLQSFGSASTIAIGAGMVGDVTSRRQRGGFMGIFQTGSLLPLGGSSTSKSTLIHSAVGPILGGVFSDTLGWRAIFWFLAIYAGVFLCFVILFVPETLRLIVGDGSRRPPRALRAFFEGFVTRRDSNKPSPKLDIRIKVDFLQSLRCLFLPEIGIVVFALALHYATWQMAITAQSSLFKSRYGLNDLQIGMTFLSNGLGCMLGALSTGRLLDVDYQHFKAKHDTATEIDFPIEQARLRTLWIWSPIQWMAVLLFGWTIDRHLHIAAPIVASFALAWAAMSAQSVVSTYIVDCLPDKSASATASLNLGRCILGAAATASVDASIDTLGVGWTMTMWTLFLVLSLGLIAVQMRHGPGWRQRRERSDPPQN